MIPEEEYEEHPSYLLNVASLKFLLLLKLKIHLNGEIRERLRDASINGKLTGI